MFNFIDDSTVRIQTPAKLNLFLEVVGKRSDGFHDIETLITPISLYDQMEMRLANGGGIELDCRWLPGWQACSKARSRTRDPSPSNSDEQGHVWSPLPAPQDNLAYRALKRLQDASGSQEGASITLYKSIPAEAGLGGASSDAAAALVGANRLWKLGWSRDRLAELAAELGSDIPFFFQSSPAICTGRGEKVRRLKIRPLHFVVLKPPAGLSTAAVYQACRPGQPPQSVGPLEEALQRGPLKRVADLLFNRLEPPSQQLTRWIDRAQNALMASGSLAARMTGSGTCCYGLYRNARQARRAAAHVRQRNIGGVCAVANCGSHANQIEGVA